MHIQLLPYSGLTHKVIKIIFGEVEIWHLQAKWQMAKPS